MAAARTHQAGQVAAGPHVDKPGAGWLTLRSWLGAAADHSGTDGWKLVAGPAGFALIALGLLIYDHVQERVTPLVFWLTVALIASVFIWLVQANLRGAATIARQQRGALRDRATGLLNRAKLEADVAAALADPGGRNVLMLLELDGLASYKDRFGFTAGDALLRRVAERLVHAVEPLRGAAYSVDSTRFAVLVPAEGAQLGEIVLAATHSLVEGDDGLLFEAAHGGITLPDEAADPEHAFQVAGQRLAARKQRQRRSASRQAHASLLAVMKSRRPELREHLRDLSFRVLGVGRRMGLEEDQLDDIVRAAQLQDIGLLTVPEAVLEKRGALSDQERELIHSHPIAGERIVGAAPGLAPVATLVRSSYERFDGSGYPDGLAGSAIPLGSRIISVCVSFSALTEPRPYRPVPLPSDQALAEMRSGAGTQFDPDVIAALAQDLDAAA